MKYLKRTYTWNRILFGLAIGLPTGFIFVALTPLDVRHSIFPYNGDGIWGMCVLISLIITPIYVGYLSKQRVNK